MLAPAMDLDMFQHPTTVSNIKSLTNDGVIILDSEFGELASGLVGTGRMMEPESIFQMVESYFEDKDRLAGKKVLVNAGPTYETIDPVRFIGNHSSGKMGFAIAEKFADAGAISIRSAHKPSSTWLFHSPASFLTNFEKTGFLDKVERVNGVINS